MGFITEFDFSVLNFIYENIRCDFLDPIMRLISDFADKGIGWIVLALILLIPQKTRKWGIIALLAVIIGFISGELILKNIIQRVRPYEAYPDFFGTPLPFALNAGTESSTSFPSGHTCCSFASAVVYFKASKKWGAVALIFAFLVGFSRMYNYVHFLTDVLGGALLGTFSALLAVWLYNRYLENIILKKSQAKELKNDRA